MKEHRVFGPPGTGKTHWLSRQIERAVLKWGPGKVLVTSFTRTAALEIATRLRGDPESFDPERFGVEVDRRQVGTLHSIGYELLGRPPVAESKKLIDDWNSRQPEEYQQTGSTRTVENPFDDPGEKSGRGDQLKQEINLLRARRISPDLWPPRLQAFWREWEAFKDDTQSVDYTDMIERPLEENRPAPGNPAVIFADETQDYAPLELALLRHWAKAESVEQLVIAGDDDQCIFSFRGATPDAFLDPPLPPDQITVLGQSHRLPRRVKDLASRWIGQVKRRQTKEFRARDEEGKVHYMPQLGFDRASAVKLRQLIEHFERDGTVMVLASCGYMLKDILGELRFRGVPFHNPYRTSGAGAGLWNPMRGGASRLAAFLRPLRTLYGDRARLWTWEEFFAWLEVVDAKKSGMLRGSKRGVHKMAKDKAEKDKPVSLDDVRNVFPFNGAPPWEGRELEWLSGHLLGSKEKFMRYSFRVAESRGMGALLDPPQVVVGTIHSVKGGQSSAVIVAPDLSVAGGEEYLGEGHDSVLRVFYVAMTRAQKELVLCDKPLRGGDYVKWMHPGEE